MVPESDKEQRQWIPPIPLGLGVLSIATSWVLVLVYAAHPAFGIALAWIHTLALGGFTTIALAVLLHTISAFTDLEWRGKSVAGAAGLTLAIGAIGLGLSFAFDAGAAVAVFAGIDALAIAAFAAAALATLAQRAPDRGSATVARALSFVIFVLLCTAAIGVAMGVNYPSGNLRALSLAPIHGTLGIVGWLTLLTMGVSARTFRPLLGSSSRALALHIVSNAGMTLAAIVAPIGLAMSPVVFEIGCVLGMLAALAYAFDTFDRLVRATTPHRPVHAFVAVAMLWLIVAAYLVLRGQGAAAIIAALAGWIASMVYAHMHHIAVRVLATIVLGPDDETAPWELLTAWLSWTTLLFAQLAAVLLVIGWRTSDALVFDGSGIAGLLALLSYACNIASALRTARSRDRAIVILR